MLHRGLCVALCVLFCGVSCVLSSSSPSPSLSPSSADDISTWECTVVSSSPLYTGVTYDKLNCTGTNIPFFKVAGPAIVNVVKADLTVPQVKVRPIVATASNTHTQQDNNDSDNDSDTAAAAAAAAAAATAYPLQPLDQIAASSGLSVLAGINGGYFWRVDSAKFNDGVCIGKSRNDALTPVSNAPNARNYGVSDGALIINNTLIGNNCNCLGYNRPTTISIPQQSPFPSITLHSRGDSAPANVLHALTAGPLLLQTNTSGTFIAIPKDDENIGNIYEHAANTNVGLNANGTMIYFVTFDGYDGCGLFDPTCGFNSYQLAYFMKDYIGVQSAMNMDQGGSTTMFVKGFGNNGIVSRSSQDGSTRSVHNGLFLVIEEDELDI